MSPAIITQAGLPNSGRGRGRLLIRQQRVKKDGDQGGDLETPEAGAYSEYLLSVPSSVAKLERHASEPMPSSFTSPSLTTEQNLLTVPTHTSYLVKQHSHPLLPSQSTLPSTSYTLTRQLSYPTQTSSQSQNIVSTISMHAAQEIAASGQLLQLQHHKPPVRSQTLQHYTLDDTSISDKTQITSSPTVVIIPDLTVEQANLGQQHSSQLQQQQQPPHQKQSQQHLQLPSIRVKTEELQRSISSPLVRPLIKNFIKLF